MHLETNPNTKIPTPPRYIPSLGRKCKETKRMDEELLLEESFYVTPHLATVRENIWYSFNINKSMVFSKFSHLINSLITKSAIV